MSVSSWSFIYIYIGLDAHTHTHIHFGYSQMDSESEGCRQKWAKLPLAWHLRRCTRNMENYIYCKLYYSNWIGYRPNVLCAHLALSMSMPIAFHERRRVAVHYPGKIIIEIRSLGHVEWTGSPIAFCTVHTLEWKSIFIDCDRHSVDWNLHFIRCFFVLFCCECAWVEEMSIQYLIECDLRARFQVNHLFSEHMELLSDVIWAISHDELWNYRHQIVSEHFYHWGWENPAGLYRFHHKKFHLLEQIVYLCRAPTWSNNKLSCVWAIWNSFVCGWLTIQNVL